VLKNEKALVAAGIAKAGNQIIHAGAQDPGFGGFSQGVDVNPRLAGERTAE
jgi:hypothetical protein